MSRPVLKILWHMRWLIAGTLLVFIGVSAAVTLLLPETYQATAIIRVLAPERNVENPDPYSRVQAGQALARTYAEILKSPDVLEAATDRGGSPGSATAFKGSATVSYIEGTDLIRIQVEDQDPRQASSLANLLASIPTGKADISSGMSIVITNQASPPKSPVRPSMALNLALAGVLGSVFAAGGALLVNRLDSRLYAPEEVEELVGAPILGSIPDVRANGNAVPAAFAEAISGLRLNLGYAMDEAASPDVVLVTSALPGEGKTLIARALAESFARAGDKCVLVDAALRDHGLNTHVPLSSERGLGEALLEGYDDVHELLTTVENNPNLALMPAGQKRWHSGDTLSTDRARKLLSDLQQQFSAVILDGPPAFPLVDASLLGRAADGILLVVNSKKTRGRDLVRALDQLRNGNGRILGVVLNRVPKANLPAGRHRGYLDA